jgi:large subunit ribosomal protein L14e
MILLVSVFVEDESVPAVEVGRVCVKTAGREFGRKCVIVDLLDKSFMLVTGPKKVTGVKRRRVNVTHLHPLDVKLDVQKGASDEEVAAALEVTGKLEMMVSKS